MENHGNPGTSWHLLHSWHITVCVCARARACRPRQFRCGSRNINQCTRTHTSHCSFICLLISVVEFVYTALNQDICRCRFHSLALLRLFVFRILLVTPFTRFGIKCPTFVQTKFHFYIRCKNFHYLGQLIQTCWGFQLNFRVIHLK